MNSKLIKFLYFISGVSVAIVGILLFWMYKPELFSQKAILPETKESPNYTKVLVVRNEINSQEGYQEIDLSSKEWKNFLAEYDKGVKEKAEWLKNPWGIVFRAIGYPNDEVGNPKYLYAFYPQDDIAIAVLYDQALRDDASGIEWRVDLQRENGLWKIIWMGQRLRCSRTPDDGWTKGLCP